MQYHKNVSATFILSSSSSLRYRKIFSFVYYNPQLKNLLALSDSVEANEEHRSWRNYRIILKEVIEHINWKGALEMINVSRSRCWKVPSLFWQLLIRRNISGTQNDRITPNRTGKYREKRCTRSPTNMSDATIICNNIELFQFQPSFEVSFRALFQFLNIWVWYVVELQHNTNNRLFWK